MRTVIVSVRVQRHLVVSHRRKKNTHSHTAYGNRYCEIDVCIHKKICACKWIAVIRGAVTHMANMFMEWYARQEVECIHRLNFNADASDIHNIALNKSPSITRIAISSHFIFMKVFRSVLVDFESIAQPAPHEVHMWQKSTHKCVLFCDCCWCCCWP